MAKQEIVRPTQNVLPKDFKATDEQEAIAEWVKGWKGPLVVSALAGTGKTTTGVYIMDSVPANKRARAIAFNNHNVDTFKRRFAENVECTTVHSAGNSTIRKSIGAKFMDVKQYKTTDIFDAYVKEVDYKVTQDEAFKYDILDLMHFVKTSAIEVSDDTKYKMVTDRFGLNPSEEARKVVDWCMKRNNDMTFDKAIVDFDDMIYAPAYFGFHPEKCDFLFADECQDFSPAQLSLLLKMTDDTGISTYVGDKNQSIFGFAGATEDSIDQIITATNAHVLPLNTTFRCGKSHVELVGIYYPHIGLVAHENNDDGLIINIPESQVADIIQENDMVICRTTAPLIQMAFELIRQGKKVKILGKDIGLNICKPLNAIKKHRNFSFGEIEHWISVEYDKEYKRLQSQRRGRVAFNNLADKYECLRICVEIFATDCYSIDQLIEKIKNLFDDNKAAITLSTVHRAKGSEADRVIIIKSNKMPMRWEGQQDWEFQQEKNIHYVAMTRSKHALYFSAEER